MKGFMAMTNRSSQLTYEKSKDWHVEIAFRKVIDDSPSIFLQVMHKITVQAFDIQYRSIPLMYSKKCSRQE